MAKIFPQGNRNGKYTIRTSKNDRLLHIETDKGIINVHLGLEDSNGNPVDNISFIPDSTDNNGSPIAVVCINSDDKVIEGHTSIRMVLLKNKEQKKLSDIIIA